MCSELLKDLISHEATLQGVQGEGLFFSEKPALLNGLFFLHGSGHSFSFLKHFKAIPSV